jgi:hypothetical protein
LCFKPVGGSTALLKNPAEGGVGGEREGLLQIAAVRGCFYSNGRWSPTPSRRVAVCSRCAADSTILKIYPSFTKICPSMTQSKICPLPPQKSLRPFSKSCIRHWRRPHTRSPTASMRPPSFPGRQPIYERHCFPHWFEAQIAPCVWRLALAVSVSVSTDNTKVHCCG